MKEKQHGLICEALAVWFKGKMPNAWIDREIAQYSHKGQLIYLRPDIDVIIWDEPNDNLIGREVKLSYKELYGGIGQALLLLHYVNTSYLVSPELSEKERKEFSDENSFLTEKLLPILPIGLIEFYFNERGFAFKEVYSAKRTNFPSCIEIGL